MKSIAKTLMALLICLTGAISAAGAQSCSTGKCPYKNMNDAISTLLSKESQHEWQKIQWRTNASVAIQEAQAQSKPIFVFFVVKQLEPSPSKWTKQGNDTGKT